MGETHVYYGVLYIYISSHTFTHPKSVSFKSLVLLDFVDSSDQATFFQSSTVKFW